LCGRPRIFHFNLETTALACAAPWGFTVGGSRPRIAPGERVYVVCEGRLRGYAPLVRMDRLGPRYWELGRAGGAVAVTLSAGVQGFQGWRYRWWDRVIEIPFPEWKTP